MTLFGSVEYNGPKDIAATEGLPSGTINHTVSAISGEYIDAVQDVILPGPEPLVIQRFYGSHTRGSIGHGWCLNQHESIVLCSAQHNGTPVWIVGVRQPSGAQLDFMCPKSKETLRKSDVVFDLNVPKGLTNGGSNFSGRTNLKNQKLHYFPKEEKIISISGAGDRRIFTKTHTTGDGRCLCGQKKEIKVNGSKYIYEGSGKDWDSRIKCLNSKTNQLYSDVKLNNVEITEKKPFILTTSDGRKIKYFFDKHHYKKKEGEKNNRTIIHRTQFYLAKVENPYAPNEHYRYGPKALSKDFQIISKRKPEGRFLNTEYYRKGINHVGGPILDIHLTELDDYRLDRVKKQKAPVGTNQNPIVTHRFVYHCKVKNNNGGFKELLEGNTDVYDALHHCTRYTYDRDHRLTSTLQYSGNSQKSYTPYRRELYRWSDKDDQKGNLLAKVLKDSQGKVHHSRNFKYDARGNVLISKLWGKLTQSNSPELILDNLERPIRNGCDCEIKTYTYSNDGLNLVLSETDSRGKKIAYNYSPGTNHVDAKYTFNGDHLQFREFFVYDENFVVIQKVMDDGKGHALHDLSGVTERHFVDIVPTSIAPFGLPQTVDQSYLDLATGQIKFLRRVMNRYSPEGRMIEQEVFDANFNKIYTLAWEYDLHGNVIQETNALGVVTIKKYDANDNLIYQRSSSSNYSIENVYDFANRLIKQDEVHDDGQCFVISNRYDYLGKCISSINAYGHETEHVYDEFGRLIEMKSPSVVDETGQSVHPKLLKAYDIAGFPITLTDAKGREIHTEYNVRGQPLHITYPDGTQEQWKYHVDGQLIQKIAKNGSRTEYIRDFLGQVIEESLYAADGELLKKTQHRYNDLHLIQTIDPEGKVISYSYDGAGRLEWIREGNRQLQQLYDSLGRLAEIREWHGDEPHEYRVTKKIYDLLDRIVEERVESPDGALYRLIRNEYDDRGNKTLTQNGDEKIWTDYDSHNQPIKITNGMGHVTHTVYNHHHINSYGQRVLQTTTTDPLGYQTVFVYDTANRLSETIRLNPFGIKVSHQTVMYDICGNKCRVLDDVIQEGIHLKTIETRYGYSLDNQIDTIIEGVGTPEQKVTRYIYNARGEKSATVKPDGRKILYEYDGAGRMSKLHASDGMFSYRYAYNACDQVTQIKDHVLSQTNKCKYDSSGQMMKEVLGNGLVLNYTYDKFGRMRTILFPDQTGVEYIYDTANLKEMHRLNRGKRVYTHSDTHHNLAGKVTHAQLPGSNGKISYAYNKLGRCTQVQASAFHQDIPKDGFDAAGNLTKYQSQGVAYQFAYDDHYQIKSETGHEEHQYQFDSICNRVVKDGEIASFNSLNQVLQSGKETFFYDPNGNLIQRKKGEEVLVTYTYDPLDRLVQVNEKGKVTSYTYDSFNRRLAKKHPGQDVPDELFFYQGQEEIGSCIQGEIQSLRLLGNNKRNPMIALEIHGTPYIPIHDISGNVVLLLNLQGEEIERYRYTVFGESQILSPQGDRLDHSRVENPWQYASKRLDCETGLVAFGLRYYDPHCGRWITPDPAGDVDGSNLYAYVHNSPLLNWDQFGLCILNLPYEQLNRCANVETYAPVTKPPLPKITHNYLFEKYYKDYRSQEGYIPDWYGCSSWDSLKNGIELPGYLGIGFVGGIGNDLNECKKNAEYISKLIGGYNIDFVANVTHGIEPDLFECHMGMNFIATEPVRQTQKMLDNFFNNSPSDAKYLLYCHSQGAIHVRNALLDYPPELRERILVVAICPGAYIYSETCGKVKHYRSEWHKDIVPRFDYHGAMRERHTITTLASHRNASRFDHGIMSPTFGEVIIKHSENYIQNKGQSL